MIGERKQRTKAGHAIPVPKRKDFDRILDAGAKPVEKLAPKRRPKK